MATGDCSVTCLGIHDFSGASLFTAVATQNVLIGATASGARFHFVPTGDGKQVLVYLVRMD